MEARGGGAHWAVGRPRVSADQAQWPTSLSFGWLIDMWTPSCRDECMPSSLLVYGYHVGPWILVLACAWPGIYALVNMLVPCSLGPNSHAHILRPASVEFVK